MLLEVMKISEESARSRCDAARLRCVPGWRRRANHWRRAAQLFGVAEAQGELTELRRDPADQAFLDPLIARAKQALGRPHVSPRPKNRDERYRSRAFAQAREEYLNEWPERLHIHHRVDLAREEVARLLPLTRIVYL